MLPRSISIGCGGCCGGAGAGACASAIGSGAPRMQAANAAARRRETDFKLIMAGTHQPEADLSIRSFRRSLSAGSLAARRSLLWLPQELDGVADEAAALRRARAADRNGGARRFLPRSCVGA